MATVADVVLDDGTDTWPKDPLGNWTVGHVELPVPPAERKEMARAYWKTRASVPGVNDPPALTKLRGEDKTADRNA